MVARVVFGFTVIVSFRLMAFTLTGISANAIIKARIPVTILRASVLK
jgi:hypothetical protein